MPSSNNSSLNKLNHTELYQLCRGAGVNVMPNATREELISFFTGEAEPQGVTEATHPLDAWRHGIIGFLGDHWSTLEPQIKCPAKNLRHPTNPNPRPCFGCLDAQVITCVSQNTSQVEHLIRAHRPSTRNE